MLFNQVWGCIPLCNYIPTKIWNISITIEMPRVAFQVHNLRLAIALPAGSQNLSSISIILSLQKCSISIITQYMCLLGTGSFCFYLVAWTLIQVVCVSIAPFQLLFLSSLGYGCTTGCLPTAHPLTVVGYFQFGAVRNKTDINICLQILVWK